MFSYELGEINKQNFLLRSSSELSECISFETCSKLPTSYCKSEQREDSPGGSGDLVNTA